MYVGTGSARLGLTPGGVSITSDPLGQPLGQPHAAKGALHSGGPRAGTTQALELAPSRPAHRRPQRPLRRRREPPVQSPAASAALPAASASVAGSALQSVSRSPREHDDGDKALGWRADTLHRSARGGGAAASARCKTELEEELSRRFGCGSRAASLCHAQAARTRDRQRAARTHPSPPRIAAAGHGTVELLANTAPFWAILCLD